MVAVIQSSSIIKSLLLRLCLFCIFPDMIVIDTQSSLGIRLALTTLVEDTDRHQRMMQGLMEANRNLR